MDIKEYEQYKSVIQSGAISVDGLKRMIRHDEVSGWSETAGGLARERVLQRCIDGEINPFKLVDEVGDRLYGVEWPLPLNFEIREQQN